MTTHPRLPESPYYGREAIMEDETPETQLDRIERLLTNDLPHLLQEMREGFTGMSNNFGWIDKRLTRLEAERGLPPLEGSLWGPSA